jgi:excisionase family DNA binding protein
MTRQSLLLRGIEVADELGISRALAYRWMASGVLPTVRVPGSRAIRVPREALLEWVEENTRKPEVMAG